MQRCFAQATQILLVGVLAAPAGTLARADSPQLLSSTPQSDQTPSTDLTPEVRGDLAMAHQQYLEAIDDYSQAPDKIRRHLEQDWAWPIIISSRLTRPAATTSAPSSLRPDYPEALNNLGAIYYARKNYGKALKVLPKKPLQHNPQSAPIYSNLGTAYFARGKVNEGIEAYRKAFAIDPHVFESGSALLVNESLPAHERAEQDYCLAKLFAESGKNQQAIEYLRKALNEGFTDRKKILEDQTLASLRATPEFSQLMAEQKTASRH